MSRPLKVVVTRPRRQAQLLCALLEKMGAHVVAVPVIEILPAPSPEQVLAQIGACSDYDLMIFISTNAVRFGRDYLPAQDMSGVQIAAVGPSTARALGEVGLDCDILPPAGFSSEALLREPSLNDVDGKRILIVRGSGGRALLGETLTQRGATVQYAEVYRRQIPPASRARLAKLIDANEIDVITATSVETLCNIEELVGEERAEALHQVKLLTASERVVKKAAQMGFNREVLLARAPDDESLVAALRAWQTQQTMPTPGPENDGMATDKDRTDKQPETPQTVATAAAAAAGSAQPAQPDAVADPKTAKQANTTSESTPVDDGDEQQPATAESTPPGRSKSGRAAGALALLLALAALLLSGYTLWQIRKPVETEDPLAAVLPLLDGVRSDTQRQLNELTGTVDSKLGRIDLSAVDDLADNQAQLQRSLRGQERSLETITDRLSSLDNDMSALRGVSTSVRNTWVRAEAEYFLQTANSRLQLAKDVNSALQALRAADERIGALGDPGLIPVRAKLTEEIIAVEAVPQPDVEGMALALNALADRVDELPLAQTLTSRLGREREELDDVKGWERAKKSVAGVFSQIVRVTPSDGSLTELMAPEQAFFLYRNLQINLQIARLALMKGDTENFHASIRAAREWLTTHFDQEDPGVISSVDRLTQMLKVDVNPPVPDISGSLRMLRALVAASGVSQ